jgi:hypothetical protein
LNIFKVTILWLHFFATAEFLLIGGSENPLSLRELPLFLLCIGGGGGRGQEKKTTLEAGFTCELKK